MKSTLGKLGMGFAGAVAFAGLMSTGIPTAEAQLELVPSPSVGVNPTTKLSGSGNYYIYTYSLAIANPIGAGSNLTASANGNLGSLNPVSSPLPPGGVADPGGYANSAFQIQDFYGYDATAEASLLASTPLGTKAGSAASSIDVSTVGSWTLVANGSTLDVYWTGDTAGTAGNGYYNGSTMTNSGSGGYQSLTVAPGTSASGNNTVNVGLFQFASIYGPSSVLPPIYNFNSSLNQGTNNDGTGGSRTIGNPEQVEIPAAPLPAAFWPGLLTIGGMAVVGGLRLRRRTV